jgi:hypothetical protein
MRSLRLSCYSIFEIPIAVLIGISRPNPATTFSYRDIALLEKYMIHVHSNGKPQPRRASFSTGVLCAVAPLSRSFAACASSLP